LPALSLIRGLTAGEAVHLGEIFQAKSSYFFTRIDITP
jgi:hypothetical protein